MNPISVPPPGNHYKPWRDGEDRKLRDFASAGLSARAIGRRLGRTTVAVRTRAVHLGIRLNGAPANGAAADAPWHGDRASVERGAAPPAVDASRCAVCDLDLTGDDLLTRGHDDGRRQHLACHFGEPAVEGGRSAGAMVRTVSLVERARETVAASVALRQKAARVRDASRASRSA